MDTPRKGEERDRQPTGDAEGWGTCRGTPHTGDKGWSTGRGGMDRGMGTPQRDEEHSGDMDAHEGVILREREEAQLGDTPERGW